MNAETPPAREAVRLRFAKRLTEELAKRNWNQSALAREASKHLPGGEIARDNISNYVCMRALPNPPFLLAIARALGTTPDDLLPERGVPIPRDGTAYPTTDVRDAGGGRAFLRVNKQVSWKTAVTILQLIHAEQTEFLRETQLPPGWKPGDPIDQR